MRALLGGVDFPQAALISERVFHEMRRAGLVEEKGERKTDSKIDCNIERHKERREKSAEKDHGIRRGRPHRQKNKPPGDALSSDNDDDRSKADDGDIARQRSRDQNDQG